MQESSPKDAREDKNKQSLGNHLLSETEHQWKGQQREEKGEKTLENRGYEIRVTCKRVLRL